MSVWACLFIADILYVAHVHRKSAEVFVHSIFSPSLYNKSYDWEWNVSPGWWWLKIKWLGRWAELTESCSASIWWHQIVHTEKLFSHNPKQKNLKGFGESMRVAMTSLHLHASVIFCPLDQFERYTCGILVLAWIITSLHFVLGNIALCYECKLRSQLPLLCLRCEYHVTKPRFAAPSCMLR